MQLFKRAALKAFYNKHRYAIAGLTVCFAFVLLAATNVAIRHTRQVAVHATVARANAENDGVCDDGGAWSWFYQMFGVDLCSESAVDTGGGGADGWPDGGSTSDCFWDYTKCTNNMWNGQSCPDGTVRTIDGSCMDEGICRGPNAAQYSECGVINISSGGPDPVTGSNYNPGGSGPVDCGDGWWNPYAQRCFSYNSGGPYGGGGTGTGGPGDPNTTNGGAGAAVTPPPISCATGYHWTEFGCMIDPDAEPTPTPTIHTPTPTVRCWDGSIPGGDYAGCDPVPTPTPTVTVVATPVPDCAGEANRDCNYDYETSSNPGTTDNNGTGGSGALNWLRRIIRGIF